MQTDEKLYYIKCINKTTGRAQAQGVLMTHADALAEVEFANSDKCIGILSGVPLNRSYTYHA